MSDWEDHCGSCDSENDLAVRCDICLGRLIDESRQAERAIIVDRFRLRARCVREHAEVAQDEISRSIAMAAAMIDDAAADWIDMGFA